MSLALNHCSLFNGEMRNLRIPVVLDVFCTHDAQGIDDKFELGSRSSRARDHQSTM